MQRRSPEGIGAESLVSEAMGGADTMEVARGWLDLGGTHFAIRMRGFGFTTVEQHIGHFAEVRRLVD